MSSHTAGKLSQSLTLKRVQSWTNYPSRLLWTVNRVGLDESNASCLRNIPVSRESSATNLCTPLSSIASLTPASATEKNYRGSTAQRQAAQRLARARDRAHSEAVPRHEKQGKVRHWRFVGFVCFSTNVLASRMWPSGLATERFTIVALGRVKRVMRRNQRVVSSSLPGPPLVFQRTTEDFRT